MMSQENGKYGVIDPHPYFNNMWRRMFIMKVTIAECSCSLQILVTKLATECELASGRLSPTGQFGVDTLYIFHSSYFQVFSYRT